MKFGRDLVNGCTVGLNVLKLILLYFIFPKKVLFPVSYPPASGRMLIDWFHPEVIFKKYAEEKREGVMPAQNWKRGVAGTFDINQCNHLGLHKKKLSPG